jgi:hypothetical protein
MSVQRISVEVPEVAASVTGQLKPLANDPIALQRLADFLSAIASGSNEGKVRLNVGAVQAVNQVAFDSFVENDTVTVNGVVITAKDASPTSSQFIPGATDEACANAFAAFINASALDKIVGVVVATRKATALLSSFVTTDTFTINGVVFTGKTTPDVSVDLEFGIGGSDAITAENLKNQIMLVKAKGIYAGLKVISSITRSTATLTILSTGSITLAETGSDVTIDNDMVVLTSIVGGQIGNLLTLAISAHGGVTGANFASGTEGTQTVFADNAGVGAL